MESHKLTSTKTHSRNYSTMESGKSHTPEDYYRYGHKLLKREYAKAIKAFSKVIEKNNEYKLVYYYRGLAYFKNHQYEEAKNDFKLSAELGHAWHDSMMQLARICEKQDDYQAAKKFYDDVDYAIGHKINKEKVYDTDVIYMHEKVFQLLAYRAAFYYRYQKYSYVIQDCKAMISMDRKYLPAWFYLANTHLQLNDHDRAMNGYLWILEQNPGEEMKSAIRESIYELLSNFKMNDSHGLVLHRISTRKNISAIKKLPDKWQLELLEKCLAEGEELHEYLKQNCNYLFGYKLSSYDIFDVIKEYIANMKDRKLYALDEHHEQGCKWLEKKEYDKAIQAFTRVLEEDDECKIAYYQRGVAYFLAGQYLRAKDDFMLCSLHFQMYRAIPYFPLAQARISESQGDYELAESHYNEALHWATLMRVEFYDDRALDLRVYTHSEGIDWLRMCRAKCYFDQRKYQQVIAECTEIINSGNTGNQDAYLYRAKAYVRLKDLGNAIYNYFWHTREPDADKQIRDDIGEIIFAILATLEPSDDLDNITIKDLVRIIKTLTKKNKIELLMKCLAEGDPLYLRLKKGDGWFVKNDDSIFDEIRKYLEDILPTNINDSLHLNVEKCYRHGCELMEQEEYDQAIEAFTRVIEKEGQYANAHYYRGLAYLHNAKYAEAKDDLMRSAELGTSKDDDPYLMLALARISDSQGDYQSAEHYYNQAVYENPIVSIVYSDSDRLYPRMCRGKFYHEREKYMLAVNVFSDIIDGITWNKINECDLNSWGMELIDPWLARAKSWIKLKDYGGAILDYWMILSMGCPKEKAIQVREYIYVLLLTAESTDSLSKINTWDLLRIIKEFSKAKQLEVFTKCFLEGDPLHIRFKQGDELYLQARSGFSLAAGYKSFFSHNIFDVIKEYISKELKVNMDNFLQSVEIAAAKRKESENKVMTTESCSTSGKKRDQP